jgi:hypothetical protein
MGVHTAVGGGHARHRSGRNLAREQADPCRDLARGRKVGRNDVAGEHRLVVDPERRGGAGGGVPVDGHPRQH